MTAHSTAEWTGQQLREALPFEQIPRYLFRVRDRIFGNEFREDVKAMGITEVLSSPRSPWQRAYVERVIGTIRSECLDHMIVLSEASLYRHVKSFLAYYHEPRTHLSLAKDPPAPARSLARTRRRGCTYLGPRRTPRSPRSSITCRIFSQRDCSAWMRAFREEISTAMVAAETLSRTRSRPQFLGRLAVE